jgi:hypothetical protein
MVEITLPIVLQILQTAGILVGISYYLVIMRNSQKTRELALKAQELTLQSQELTRKAQQQALETRQAQLFMNIYNLRWNDPHFDDVIHRIDSLRWKDWDEYQALFDYSNPETRDNHLAMSTLMNFYTGVGVLLKLNLVDIRLISYLMSNSTRAFWEKVESIVEEAREHWYGPGFLTETEYLYNELVKYLEEHPEFESPEQQISRRAHIK